MTWRGAGAWGAVLAAALWLAGCSAEQKPASERVAAPDFTLARLDGSGTVSLSQLRGKTVVIDFWATWCPPCEYQVAELNAVYEAHRGDEIEVIGVSVDTEGPEVVSKWTREKGVEYTILMGDEELARRFGAMGFPTLVIVGPDGLIRSRHMGLTERAEVEKALAEGPGSST
jgi:peroxiredoxin